MKKITMTPDQMLNMLLSGYTYEAIGKAANVSRQRVQQILSPPRPIRSYVIKKYNGICQDCGIRVGVSGHVHHIKNNPNTYDDIDNLILLCISCHRKAHHHLTDSPFTTIIDKVKSYLVN